MVDVVRRESPGANMVIRIELRKLDPVRGLEDDRCLSHSDPSTSIHWVRPTTLSLSRVSGSHIPPPPVTALRPDRFAVPSAPLLRRQLLLAHHRACEAVSRE